MRVCVREGAARCDMSELSRFGRGRRGRGACLGSVVSQRVWGWGVGVMETAVQVWCVIKVNTGTSLNSTSFTGMTLRTFRFVLDFSGI